MRARNWILGSAATASLIMACVGAGCGGSSENGPSPDAGQDVTVDHATPMPDAAPDVIMDSAMMCAVDADLTMLHIDAGDGGACIACVQSHCSAAISDCNMDCDCKSAFLAFLACTGMGGSITTCGIQTLGNIDTTIQQEFFTCAPPCASTCGVMLDGGREGGDGSSDAGDAADGD
jgi:hypothetical protein